MISEENKKEYSDNKLSIYFAISYLKTVILHHGSFTTWYLILYFLQWKSLLSTPLWLISHDNLSQSFLGCSDSKKSACNAGDPGSFLGLGRSLGERYGNPLQYACLENPMDQRAWVGHSLWDHKESDMTEPLTLYLSGFIYT